MKQNYWLLITEDGKSTWIESKLFKEEYSDELLKQLRELVGKVNRLTKKRNEIDSMLSEAREDLLNLMSINNIDKLDTPKCKVNKVSTSSTTRFDVSLFKKDYKDLYEKYKVINVPSTTYLSIKMKGVSNNE